jgi:hypothetical protein
LSDCLLCFAIKTEVVYFKLLNKKPFLKFDFYGMISLYDNEENNYKMKSRWSFMKYFWTFFWVFLLSHMLTYIVGSIKSASYDFTVGTILAIGISIFLFLIAAVMPKDKELNV